jgi:hypothetical protein
MHLRLTARCQISILIFEKKLWRGVLYKYPMKNISTQFVFKYLSWYLTPCCGLEVHYPTKALKSVKDPGNTFNLAQSGQELCVLDIFFMGYL